MFFYTRYVYGYYTKIKPNNIISLSGRLVQVISGNGGTCSDAVVFWCSSELGFLNWEISTKTGSFFVLSTYNSTVRLNLLLDSSLVAQVTFNNGSFINATITIMRPINLNRSIIYCNRDMLTLNIPANTGKFLVTGFGIESRGNLLF